MNSSDLTLAQLDALFARSWRRWWCLKKLANRMHQECFPADDELFKLVEQASAAMHRPAIDMHYQACEKGKRKPKPQ